MKDHHENCPAPTVGCRVDSTHCAEPGSLLSVGALPQHFNIHYNEEYLRQRRTADNEEDGR